MPLPDMPLLALPRIVQTGRSLNLSSEFLWKLHYTVITDFIIATGTDSTSSPSPEEWGKVALLITWLISLAVNPILRLSKGFPKVT